MSFCQSEKKFEIFAINSDSVLYFQHDQIAEGMNESSIQLNLIGILENEDESMEVVPFGAFLLVLSDQTCPPNGSKKF